MISVSLYSEGRGLLREFGPAKPMFLLKALVMVVVVVAAVLGHAKNVFARDPL
jgi:hypothetical protein